MTSPQRTHVQVDATAMTDTELAYQLMRLPVLIAKVNADVACWEVDLAACERERERRQRVKEQA